MREHMDGTTSSSLYELRLGREKFGKDAVIRGKLYERVMARAARDQEKLDAKRDQETDDDQPHR